MPQLGLDNKQNSVLPGIQIKSKPEPDCVFPKKEWTVMSSVLIVLEGWQQWTFCMICWARSSSAETALRPLVGIRLKERDRNQLLAKRGPSVHHSAVTSLHVTQVAWCVSGQDQVNLHPTLLVPRPHPDQSWVLGKPVAVLAQQQPLWPWCPPLCPVPAPQQQQLCDHPGLWPSLGPCPTWVHVGL